MSITNARLILKKCKTNLKEMCIRIKEKSFLLLIKTYRGVLESDFSAFCVVLFLKENTENVSQILTLTTQNCLLHADQQVTSYVGHCYFFFSKACFKYKHKYSSFMHGQFVIDRSEDSGYGAWGGLGLLLFCTVCLKSH